MDILIKKIEKDFLKSRISEFIGILSGEPHEYWNEEHFMSDRPGKFDLSIVALTENRIAGYIISSLKNEEPYIHKFMVNRDLRSQSVGRKMLLVFEETIIKKGYSNITLSVIEENKRAINFYSANGFNIFSTRKSSEGNLLLVMMNKTVKTNRSLSH